MFLHGVREGTNCSWSYHVLSCGTALFEYHNQYPHWVPAYDVHIYIYMYIHHSFLEKIGHTTITMIINDYWYSHIWYMILFPCAWSGNSWIRGNKLAGTTSSIWGCLKIGYLQTQFPRNQIEIALLGGLPKHCGINSSHDGSIPTVVNSVPFDQPAPCLTRSGCHQCADGGLTWLQPSSLVGFVWGLS